MQELLINIKKIFYSNIFLSFLLSYAFILNNGIHYNLRAFILILFILKFLSKKVNLFQGEALPADIVISTLLLSISGEDYSSIISVRDKFHGLAPLLPMSSLFISFIYIKILNKFKWNYFKFLRELTFIPLLSLLIVFLSVIINQASLQINYQSALIIILIISFYYLLRDKINIQDFRIFKIYPLLFFLLLIILCKSKANIIISLLAIIFNLRGINYFKDHKYNIFFYKLINYLYISFFILILAFSLYLVNPSIIGFNIADKFSSQRLSINNQYLNICSTFNINKTNPTFIPNKENIVRAEPYKQISEKFKIINNYNKKDNKFRLVFPHNTFVYYKCIHNNFYNISLYLFLTTCSLYLIFRNGINNIHYLYIFIFNNFFNNISYLIMLIILFVTSIIIDKQFLKNLKAKSDI